MKTVGSPFLGFFTDQARHARNARKAAMNHDPINAALWAIAAFDTTLAKFADIREDLALRYPDNTEPLRVTIDNAIGTYINEQATQLREVNNLNEKQVDEIANNKIQARNINKTAMMALSCATHTNNYHLMVNIVAYTITMAALSSYGPAPFHRFADVIAESYEQFHPKPYKTPTTPETTP